MATRRRGHVGLCNLQARQLLDDLQSWLRGRLLMRLNQSDTSGAVHYLLDQWRALRQYRKDGIAEIGKNIAENAMRGCYSGRTNFLLVGGW